MKYLLVKLIEKKRRLSLVLKDVNSEPWKVHGESIKDGAVMEGKVVRLTNFGAFVEVLPGVEGLDSYYRNN